MPAWKKQHVDIFGLLIIYGELAEELDQSLNVNLNATPSHQGHTVHPNRRVENLLSNAAYLCLFKLSMVANGIL